MENEFTELRNIKMMKDEMQFEVWDGVNPNDLKSGYYCSTKKVSIEKVLQISEFVKE